MTWTEKDDQICQKAEKSGITIDKQTQTPLTFEQLDKLALEYDKVRATVTVEEFFDKHLTTKPVKV